MEYFGKLLCHKGNKTLFNNELWGGNSKSQGYHITLYHFPITTHPTMFIPYVFIVLQIKLKSKEDNMEVKVSYSYISERQNNSWCFQLEKSLKVCAVE